MNGKDSVYVHMEIVMVYLSNGRLKNNIRKRKKNDEIDPNFRQNVRICKKLD